MLSKLSRRFKSIRLHSRIFLICSFVLIAMLICSALFISFPTINIIIDDYIQTSKRDISLISTMTESTLSHLSNYAISIATDSRVIDAVRSNPNGLNEDADAERLRRTLGQSIRTTISLNTDIFRYDLFTLNGEPFGVSGNTYPFGLENRLPEDFFQSAAKSLAPQIHGPFTTYSLRQDKLPVYILTKSIVNLDTHQPYGVLLLFVRESRFSHSFSKVPVDPDVSYFIVNDALNIVSCADDSRLNEHVPDVFGLTPDETKQLRRHGEYIMRRDGDSLLFMLSDTALNRTDWKILMVTSMHGTQAAWQQVFSNMLVIAAVSFLVLLAISYTLARSVSQPIYHMVEAIHSDMLSDNMHPLPVPDASPEVKLLYKTYNELNTHIALLLDHINQEQEEKSNIKFKLIQAQIKPHFLYNTLMTIKSLIDLEMNETASECVYAMSSFYRLSLNKGNEILRLGDEIELSMQYMYIQKLRYIDRLDYVFDVPHTLYDYFVPKMTIQPILENAIYHGVKEKADKGIIQVTGRDLGDCMEFTITDNGRGMDSDTLARLQASLNSIGDEIQPRSESFGLYSVNRRIHMLYGKSYGLHVDSRLGEYTMVTLTLPKSTSIGGIS